MIHLLTEKAKNLSYLFYFSYPQNLYYIYHLHVYCIVFVYFPVYPLCLM